MIAAYKIATPKTVTISLVTMEITISKGKTKGIVSSIGILNIKQIDTIINTSIKRFKNSEPVILRVIPFNTSVIKLSP